MAFNQRDFRKDKAKPVNVRTLCSANPVRNFRRDKNMGQTAKISNGVKIFTLFERVVG